LSSQVCSDGLCVFQIGGGGQTLCNGVLVNTLTDSNNCGRCGNVCPSDSRGWLCVSGICCPQGVTDLCPTTNPLNPEPFFCTDLQSAQNNCGSCGKICPQNPGLDICFQGLCVDYCEHFRGPGFFTCYRSGSVPGSNLVCCQAGDTCCVDVNGNSYLCCPAGTTCPSVPMGLSCIGPDGSLVFGRGP
jgi:hypothetical protein